MNQHRYPLRARPSNVSDASKRIAKRRISPKTTTTTAKQGQCFFVAATFLAPITLDSTERWSSFGTLQTTLLQLAPGEKLTLGRLEEEVQSSNVNATRNLISIAAFQTCPAPSKDTFATKCVKYPGEPITTVHLA